MILRSKSMTLSWKRSKAAALSVAAKGQSMMSTMTTRWLKLAVRLEKLYAGCCVVAATVGCSRLVSTGRPSFKRPLTSSPTHQRRKP
jgi:hypothetical protein